MLLDVHAAPCVYPSGVCTNCSKVDQLRIVPSPNDFSTTGTNDFSVSSELCRPIRPWDLNWLTIGIHNRRRFRLGKSRRYRASLPTQTQAGPLSVSSLLRPPATRWQAALRAIRLEGRSWSLTRRFADGEGSGFLSSGNLEYRLAPAAPASVRRQYALALSLSTHSSAPCRVFIRKFSTRIIVTIWTHPIVL